MTVLLGLDRLRGEEGRRLEGRSVALLAHPASVDSKYLHAEEVVRQAKASLTVLLGPEHGYGGEAQDMEVVGYSDAESKGPRSYSLYGDTLESLRPTAEMLEGVEVLVVDLQDVGARYYTFVWTAAMCLEACHDAGVTLLVLDRPNPIGGTLVEGPAIEEGFTSFVGHHDVCTRHGMTMAELLTLYARERGLEDALEVVPIEGWTRSMSLGDAGLPWVMPSPNMPLVETALVYPGMCLLEGTNLSEGRGTTRPFELFGAPWLDGRALKKALDESSLPGCVFRPCTFKPTFQKHAGEICGGVQLHVTDPGAFRPVRTGVAVLRAAFLLGQGETSWRADPYEFVIDRQAIDLLAGGSWLREGIEAGASLDDLCSPWPEREAAFLQRRTPALLYR